MPSEWAWFELTREPVSPAAGSHLEHSSHDRHTRRATRERCVRSVSLSSCRSLRRLCLLLLTTSSAAIAPLKQFLVDAASLRPPSARCSASNPQWTATSRS